MLRTFDDAGWRRRTAWRLAMIGSLAALGGCAAPISAEQRHATDLNPSGRPSQAPAVYQAYGPPNSTNAFDPLYCHSEGPGTVCSRGGSQTPAQAGGN